LQQPQICKLKHNKLTLWCPCGVALPNVFRILKIFPREEVAHHLILQIDNACLTGFPTLRKIKIKKKIFLPPTPLLSHFVPLFHISFIHLISLPSSFSISLRSISPSHFATSIPHGFYCLSLSLSLLVGHSAPSFLSFRPIPAFSLLVPTSKSRHHFSFFCTVSSQVLRNFLCYTPSLILSLLSCLPVPLSLSISSTFIHLAFDSVFPLFH
jgi:hypothetical protein